MPRSIRLTTLAAVLAATLLQAVPASAAVLQTATAERPWNQEWASWSCQDSSRFGEVSSPVAQGGKAYKLTVQDGDNSWGERCELGDGNPTRNGFPVFHEGDDVWISFSVYLPDNYPINTPDWNVMFQIHQEGDGGCPPIAMHVEDGEWKLFNSSRPTYVLDTVEKWHAPAERNRWTKFTIHLMNSGDDNKGFVELYSDLAGQGMQQVMPRTYMHTMTVRSDGSPMTNHARIGIYRNPAIQGTTDIYFDGFTIATDRASAEATAFGDVQPPVVTQPPNPGPTTAPPTTTTSTPPPVVNPVTVTTPTPPSNPTPPQKKRPRRVVLRTHKARSLVHASGVWPSVLPVYGWVKRGRHMAGRSVTIEIRRDGRWEQLARGWLRRSRRFYLAVPVEPGTSGDVMLRARVAGVGDSGPVAAHL
jgi:hypothetical protein